MKKTATPSFPMNFTFFDMLELFCYINNIPYGCMLWIKRKRWNKWHRLQYIFIYENPHMYLEQLKLNEIWKKHVIYLCSKCHCNEPIDANYCKRISLSNGEKTKKSWNCFIFLFYIVNAFVWIFYRFQSGAFFISKWLQSCLNYSTDLSILFILANSI